MKTSSLFFFLFCFTAAYAQVPSGNFSGQRAAGQNMNVGHLYGKIVDSKTNKGVDGATILLITQKPDTTTKKMKDVVVSTQIAKGNGDFSFDGLAVFAKYKMRVTFIGYKDLDQEVSFGLKMPQGGQNGGDGSDRMQQMMGMIDKDLGNIKIEQSETTLAGVTVVGSSKPFFEMGVDRKIFNVDKNIVSQGQTATEVMKQIPSLNVDVDGNVTMRNATPQLFVDGRPTTLTLEQIPADIIDKVELITNPSAKYDASGGGAGILNIVLKKNIKTGYNGGIRAGVDSRGKLNLGGDINLRQNKVNFFLSAFYNQRKSLSWSNTDRVNLLTPPSHVLLDDEGTNVGSFAFIRGGLDIFVDNRNTISIAGNYNRGKFNNDNIQRIDSTLDGDYISYSTRTTNSNFNFKNFGTQLSFKHNFAKTGHDINADLNYNGSDNNSIANFVTNTFTPDDNPKFRPLQQKTLGVGYNRFTTFQLDYENPIKENTKFEAGARVAIRNFRNENSQFFYNESVGDFVPIPSISNNYSYDDKVYAAYSNYSLKGKKWNYQLGLRIESSDYKGKLIGKDSLFNVNFPISIFPSAFITYRVTDKQDLQVNFSRRINRPNFFQLLPFVDFSDPQNLNVGNAGLKPEFTNSFEFSYNKSYKNNSNFLATLFLRYTTDLITRYQYVGISPLDNTDTVVYNTFANANSSVAYGLELTNKTTVAKIWDVTLNLNLFNSRINADNLENNLNNERLSWFVKWNNSIRLPKKYTIQFSGNYQAKTVLPPGGGGGFGGRGGGGGGGGFFGGGSLSAAQGFIYPVYGFDIAIRKEWQWKGGNTASVNVSMNDIFRTQVNKVYSESEFFYQTALRRRDPQVLRINFSYRFGKFDASLFKRKNTKADQGGGMDMMGQ